MIDLNMTHSKLMIIKQCGTMCPQINLKNYWRHASRRYTNHSECLGGFIPSRPARIYRRVNKQLLDLPFDIFCLNFVINLKEKKC